MTQITRTEQKQLDAALYVTLTDHGALLVRCRRHLGDEEPSVVARARQVIEKGVSIRTCEVCQPAAQPVRHAASHR